MTRIPMLRYARHALLGSTTMALSLWCPAAAVAQVADPQSAAAAQSKSPLAEDGEAPASDIVVTGSRIARRDFESASPISTISQEAVQATGEVTIERSLAQLPQFGIGSSSTQTGFGSTGQATLNLRGLGSNRNLVLLDGRRMMPANVALAVDVNIVPKTLIESVEVITGGASSTYGSDAISGVVNFRTKKNFEGLLLDGQYNLTSRGDGAAADLSATLGSNFAGGRGNAVFFGSYTKRDPIPFRERAFFRRNEGGTDLRIPTGAYTPGANLPSQTAVDALFGTYGFAPGTVPRDSALSFNADGTLFSASNGVVNYRGDQGGLLFNTGKQVNNLNTFLILQAPLERYTAFGRVTYDLTDTISAFAQTQFVNYTTQVVVEPGNAALTIPITNPFIPAELRQVLQSRANPNAPLSLQKRFYEAGPRLTNSEFTVFQAVAGLNGKLPAIDGTWEVYGSHGSTAIDEDQPGSVLSPALNQLANAADGGRSLCEGGYDPFGVTTLSQSCYDFLVATPFRRTRLKQDVVEANIQGGLFNLPGGQVRFAAGVDYRRNTYDTKVDRVLQAGQVVGVQFTTDSEGTVSAKEAFAELLVPVLKDARFFQSLELSAGYRYSDYNLSGGVHTYKFDATWKPVDALMFRGGYARAVRAPSVGELFLPNNGAIPNIGQPATGGGDPCTIGSPARRGADAAAVRALCLAQGVPATQIDTFVNNQIDTQATNSGNRGLRPETADTFTVGLVISPRFSTPWLLKFNVAVDYYNIKVDDAIGVVSARESLSSCFNYNGLNSGYSNDNFFCQNIQRSADGRLSNVFQRTQNLGGYKTAGVDVQVDWAIGLDAVGLDDGSSIAINSAVSWLDKFEIQTTPTSTFVDYAGAVGAPTVGTPGSLPKWKATSSVAYQSEKFRLGLRWRHLSKMRSVQLITNPNATVPGQDSYNLFDLYGSINISPDYSLRFGVNNVFDKEPPVLDGRLGVTEPSTYDILGRSLYLGVSAKF